MKEKFNIFFFSIFLLLPTVFFGVPSECLAKEALKINKVQFDGGTGKSDEDFIEITNTSDQEINLKGYRLAKITSSGKRYNIKSWTSETIVPAEKKYVWACNKNDFASSIQADASTSETISRENEIVVILGSLDEGTIIDSYVWEEADEESGDDPEGNNETTNYAGKMIINEILPSPESGKKEFLELLNLSEEKIDIKDWYILDEKNNKKIISREKNEVEKYFYKFDSFSLNSEGDTVFLYDGNKNLIDKVSYTKSKTGYFYAFDGSAWRWTSKETPGEENKFDEKLSAKIKKDKKIYKNTYAAFEAQKNSKAAKKFTWDFGDGHKSYLKKTRHKYEKSGSYDASLKVAADKGMKGFEEAIYYFTVKVEKFEAPKIRIKAISPNPQGRDTDNEWIEIENKTKKKINLKNWSVATGTKNIVNHPIKKDFEIKAGKSKKILKKHCAFTLGNAQAKIELRSPDGKAVQKIRYDRTKNKIEEDEIYEKDEEGWNWVKPQNDTEEEQNDTENVQPLLPQGEDVSGNPETGEGTTEESVNSDINLSQEEIFSALGKSSLDPLWREKQKNKIILLSAGTNVKPPKILLENQARVLGAWTMKKSTLPEKPENLWENWLIKINSIINQVINQM